MRLHEEYIKRHKLDVPVVRFDHKANVFLKLNESPHWAVYNVDWVWGHNCPGDFHTSLNCVIHNAYQSGEFFLPFRDHVVSWDDWESHIIKESTTFKVLGWRAVSEQERTLALWQMFLYAYDGWVAQIMGRNAKFYSLVETSIREDLDMNTRSAAYRSAYRLISVNEHAKSILSHQLLPMASGHSEWLERLIND